MPSDKMRSIRPAHRDPLTYFRQIHYELKQLTGGKRPPTREEIDDAVERARNAPIPVTNKYEPPAGTSATRPLSAAGQRASGSDQAGETPRTFTPVQQNVPGTEPISKKARTFTPAPRVTSTPEPAKVKTRVPTPHQKAFLKEQLARRGLPTRQIDTLKFVSGLDSEANRFTRIALNSGVDAVTQGSTVYVQPKKFEDVSNFRSRVSFEEAYHTAQFASDRNFYDRYALLSLGGALFHGSYYRGNVYEAFAQGASKQMFEEYNSRPRVR